LLFPDKTSALVRLSDSLKVELRSGSKTAEQILSLFAQYELPFREAQSIARRIQKEEIEPAIGETLMKEILGQVPESVSMQGAAWQGQLHSQVLSVILLSCFCLESYINSLAYFLFDETDFLGLVGGGHKASSELFIEAIGRMSTREKWKTMSRLADGDGFDRSRPPFQDFHVLFNFRDDHVHDKVVDYASDRARKRYNGKLPDPVFGLLTLRHGMYATSTYWAMVEAVHELVRVPMQRFHRHYNLAPWTNDEDRRRMSDLAVSYDDRLSPGA
jgi:hypothetical protein